MRHIYTSVDIGSDTIKIVVLELCQGKYNLLAATSTKANGIKKGLINNIPEASLSLKEAFFEVEEMLGFKIKKCIVNVPSYFTDFIMVKGEIKIENTITGNDVVKVLQQSMQNNIPSNKEVVTIIPIDFAVDNQVCKEPIGLNGGVLYSRSILITTPKKNIVSVVSLFNNIDVELIDISLGCIGDIYTFKNEDIENNITSLINIGFEKTEVTLYNKGIPVKHSIINMGSFNIDRDISYMYKISLEDAKYLKEKFALAYKNQASLNETKTITNVKGEIIKVNQYEVSEIVSACIGEILTLANKEINLLSSYKPKTIYLCGGITNMINFHQISREKLSNCVIIGNVNLIGLRNNKYASAFGNVIYFVEKLKLREKDYSMLSNEEIELLSTPKKNSANNSTLGKVFGYFFGE